MGTFYDEDDEEEYEPTLSEEEAKRLTRLFFPDLWMPGRCLRLRKKYRN